MADIVDSDGNHGVVSVYQKGTTTPSSTLTDEKMTTARAIAVDRSGNVFVSCVRERRNACIIEFANGQMPGKYLGVQVGITTGLEIDTSKICWWTTLGRARSNRLPLRIRGFGQRRSPRRSFRFRKARCC